MKVSLFFILLVYPFFYTSASKSQDYLAYHATVAQAEELASNREFEKALAVYTQLFETYEFLFLRDCKVATQIALYTGNEQEAFKYMRAGIRNGWGIKSIKKNKVLAPLLQKEEWDTIENQHDSLREPYTKRLNSDLRKEVHKMFKKDQRLAIGALFRLGQKAQDRYAERKFAPNSRKQLIRLDDMLENYGYPGEKLVGNSYWMETILSHSNSISQEHVQKDTLYNYLRPKLLSALKKGEISPFELAMIDNWQITVGSGWKDTSYGYLSSALTEEELIQANQLRKEIGLRSIAVRNRLIDVQKETGINFYLPGRPGENEKVVISNTKE